MQQEISALISPFVPPERGDRDNWPTAVDGSTLFTQIEEARFRFVQELDADALCARIGSTSFIAAAPREERRDLEVRLREVVGRLGGVIAFPYVTEVYVSFAV